MYSRVLATLPFCMIFVIVGCESKPKGPAEQLRAIKQRQLNMFNAVVKIYDEDLSYAEVQDRKSEAMSDHGETMKSVKALKKEMDKDEFEQIQKEFDVLIQDAKKREFEAAHAWGDRMLAK